jgi:exodeoxyribonuclease III
LKIISYNVNGIRSAIQKGLLSWLASANADVVCLQEVKASLDQIDKSVFEEMGYHVYWMSAEKKGYSGVAILSKEMPERVEYGCGISKYDAEGRVLRVDFNNLSVMSAYFPSGSSGEYRQAFKMEWLGDFMKYIQDLKMTIPNLIISGDYNICHHPIDIHNPVSNKNSPGFLPEERDWLTQFINSGFIDTFRFFNLTPHHYSWWSYRAGARKKNLGWRIDYHMASVLLQKRLKRAAILNQALHSDHCPILLEIE